MAPWAWWTGGAHLQEMMDREESEAEMLIPLTPSLPGYGEQAASLN